MDESKVELGLTKLVGDLAACELCKHELALPPQPIFQVSSQAKILIAGQAPGLKIFA